MKLGYILAGLVFLFNPHIHIIDILPDLIGYALILYGMSQISDLERNLHSARRKFMKLAWLSAGKLGCLLILPIFDETLYLVFTLMFGIFEVIWGVPAFVELFHGISFLEERYTKHRTRHTPGAEPRFGGIMDKTDFSDGRVYFEVYQKSHENADYPADEEFVLLPEGRVTVSAAYEGFVARDEKKTPYYYESAEARVMSVIFLVVRALCAVIPELTAIMSVGDSYVHSNANNEYAGLRYLLEAALAVVALAVGAIWLYRMAKYFRVFMKDTPFLETLSAKYDAEILPNRALWVKRTTLRFCLFSTIALAFMTCVRLSVGNIVNGDGRLLFTLEAAYLIPEFLFGIMMILAFRSTREYDPMWKERAKKAGLFSAVSFVSYGILLGLSLTYGRRFRPHEDPKYIIFFVIYLLIFILSMWCFVRVLREKEKTYRIMAEEIARTLAPDDNDYALKRREHTVKDLQPKIREMTVITMVYAAFSVLCMAAIPWAEEYIPCGLSWLFRSAFCAFLLVKSLLLTDKLQHEIEKVIE